MLFLHCYLQTYGNTAKKAVREPANRIRYSAVSKETLRKNLCVKVVNLISIHAVVEVSQGMVKYWH